MLLTVLALPRRTTRGPVCSRARLARSRSLSDASRRRILRARATVEPSAGAAVVRAIDYQQRRSAMPTYITLIHYTEQGVKTFNDLSQRLDKTRSAARNPAHDGWATP